MRPGQYQRPANWAELHAGPWTILVKSLKPGQSRHLKNADVRNSVSKAAARYGIAYKTAKDTARGGYTIWRTA